MTQLDYASLSMDMLQLPPLLRQKADQYWSRFLRCSPEQLRRSENSVSVSGASVGLFALKTEGGWTTVIAPGVDPAVVNHLSELPLDDPTGVAAANALLSRYGLHNSYGPAQIAYCTPEGITPGKPITYRRLTPEDRREVEQFRADLGRDDWDFVDTDTWRAAFGIFDGDRLACASQIRVWDNLIAEIYFDTAPAYRQHGYATALAHVAARWVMDETPWIPQIDAQIDVTSSIRIINRIGFQLYGWFVMGKLSDSDKP